MTINDKKGDTMTRLLILAAHFAALLTLGYGLGAVTIGREWFWDAVCCAVRFAAFCYYSLPGFCRRSR
jgi:hypothetical protein